MVFKDCGGNIHMTSHDYYSRSRVLRGRTNLEYGHLVPATKADGDFGIEVL